MFIVFQHGFLVTMLHLPVGVAARQWRDRLVDASVAQKNNEC